MNLILPKLQLAEYRFQLTFKQEGTLPRHPGATLRGGIALLLKRSVCVHPKLTYCRDCPLRARCIYAVIFEPAPPPDSEVLSTHQDVPLPFVMRIPDAWQRYYQPGDPYEFGMVLVGKPLRYLAYVIAAVEHLGHTGLGEQRINYRLDQVLSPQFDGAVDIPVYEAGLLVRGDTAQSSKLLDFPTEVYQSTATLRFLTPTRLKHGGRFAMAAPEFHVLVRALLRRVSSLSYFYGSQRWDIDYRRWIELAHAVEIVSADMRWVDWERYSTRQRQSMNLGGIVGDVTYRGDLAPFLPLLRLGQLVHVGKSAVFGNGRYLFV